MLRRIFLSTTTATTLALTPIANAEVPVVEQGARVVVVDKGICSIGFNDPNQRISYTAGHCGEHGSRAAVGQANGTFYPSTEFGRSATGNDWGIIRWDDGVQLGANTITTDAVVDLEDLHPNDEICLLSRGQQQCGAYTGRVGNNVYWDAGAGVKGDSGAPVWAPGRGMVAVYSGVSTVSNRKSESASLNRASKPLNGPGVTEAQEIELISATKPIGTPVTHDAETPESPATNVAHSGSSASPEAIATIVVAVAVVLGFLVPFIGPVLEQFAVSVGLR